MCWKYEWASAINNLTRAMVRIDRAKKKLETRAYNRALTKYRASKKGRTDIVKDAGATLEKNKEGIRQCNQQLDSLKEIRSSLLQMINDYGFVRDENSAKTRNFMGGCTLCKTREERSQSACKEDIYCAGGGV